MKGVSVIVKEDIERMEKLVTFINPIRPLESLRIQGDSALLQNPSDLEEAERWIASWYFYHLSTPNVSPRQPE